MGQSNYITVSNLFVSDKNIWNHNCVHIRIMRNHIIVYKLLVLERNTWNHNCVQIICIENRGIVTSSYNCLQMIIINYLKPYIIGFGDEEKKKHWLLYWIAQQGLTCHKTNQPISISSK